MTDVDQIVAELRQMCITMLQEEYSGEIKGLRKRVRELELEVYGRPATVGRDMARRIAMGREEANASS